MGLGFTDDLTALRIALPGPGEGPGCGGRREGYGAFLP